MASTIDAVTIINKASQLLGDASQTYWTAGELLGWLNDGQIEIALLNPNSKTSTTAIQLVAGPKQKAPADSIRIIEFVRNMGSTGLLSGNAIRQIERKILDRYQPNWSLDTPNAVVVHAMYNAEDDNETFYVWPPQPVTPSYIEIVYCQLPTLIQNSNVGTKITLDDYYQNTLLDYVLYRAFGRGTESAGNYQRSQDHYKMFADMLTVKLENDRNANNNIPTK